MQRRYCMSSFHRNPKIFLPIFPLMSYILLEIPLIVIDGKLCPCVHLQLLPQVMLSFIYLNPMTITFNYQSKEAISIDIGKAVSLQLEIRYIKEWKIMCNSLMDFCQLLYQQPLMKIKLLQRSSSYISILVAEAEISFFPSYLLLIFSFFSTILSKAFLIRFSSISSLLFEPMYAKTIKKGTKTARMMLQTRMRFEVETLLAQKKSATDKKKKNATIRKQIPIADVISLHSSSQQSSDLPQNFGRNTPSFLDKEAFTQHSRYAIFTTFPDMNFYIIKSLQINPNL